MGFSESALYRHFKNKDAIILLLIQFLCDNVTQRFEKILKSDLEIDEKFMALFSSHFSFFGKNPHFSVIMLSEGVIDVSDEIKNYIIKLINLNIGSIATVVREGQEKRFFTKSIPTDDIVHFAAGAFRFEMLKWKMSGYTFDLEQEGNRMMKALLKLISTD